MNMILNASKLKMIAEDLLLLKTQKTSSRIQQIQTKTQETVEVKSIKARESFAFDILSQLDIVNGFHVSLL